MGGTARRELVIPLTLPATAQRTAATNQARGWLVSSEVAGWLANVAADIPEHALTAELRVTVDWR